MADEQQAKPSFKHAVAKKALGPLVASAATAAAAYLMRKAAEVWEETLQPKLEEKGGAEAVAREALDKVSSKLAPVSETVTSKVEQAPKAAAKAKTEAPPDGDRNEERRQREQRRRQRRKALEQSGSS
jgi:hypothetical protein